MSIATLTFFEWWSDLPWSVASFNPVSAMKLTVAWKRLAFLKQSITMLTSSLRSWASIPSSARSNVSQKLISWEAVPDATSLFNLVTDWIDLIQALTWPWRVFRNVLSLSSLAGICEILGRVPAACALKTQSWINVDEESKRQSSTCSTVRWITGWMMRWVSGISTFCWRWRSDSSSSANFFLVMGIPDWLKVIIFFWNMEKKWMTHFCIPVFACPSCTDKCFEPRLNATAHDCMQTLVRCFVSAEKVEKM